MHISPAPWENVTTRRHALPAPACRRFCHDPHHLHRAKTFQGEPTRDSRKRTQTGGQQDDTRSSGVNKLRRRQCQLTHVV